jgi:hypothetical protein
MILAMKKVFGISFTSSAEHTSGSPRSQTRASAPIAGSSAGKMPMLEIKQHMTHSLHDVTSIEAERLRYTIRAARNVNDLWLLRSGLYQTISRQHSQSEAALRINALLPYFKNWLPERQMSRV